MGDNYYLPELETDSLDTDDALSNSLPPRIRIYKTSDGDAVAIERDTVIDSGNDHTAVWQSAIDAVHADFTDTSDTDNRNEGVVDGGSYAYALQSDLIHKAGVKVQNASFDGQGSYRYEINADGVGTFAHACDLDNVHMVDGDPEGFRADDMLESVWTNVSSQGHTEAGIFLNSSLVNDFVGIVCNSGTDSNLGRGIRFNNFAPSGAMANLNRFIGGRVKDNAAQGVYINGGYRNSFHGMSFESNGIHGANDQSGHNLFYGPWLEGNTEEGMRLLGDRAAVFMPRAGNNNGTAVQVEADNCTVYGPINSSESLIVGSGATDTRLWNVEDSMFTDSGTRTVVNGWGENAGDPSSTGDWNTNGQEGIAVVDTTNNAKYVYRGGAWV